MSHAIRLRQILTAECDVYQRYLNLLAEEGKAIARFKSDQVEALTESRQELFERMTELKNERMAFMKELAGSEKANLGKVIGEKFSGRDKRELEALRNKLKSLVDKTRNKGYEFNQVVNFALNFVNGTVSLLMSASQNIVKSYSRSGVLKESYNPAGDARRAGMSKEA